jgi:enterochelin esterase family protein
MRRIVLWLLLILAGCEGPSEPDKQTEKSGFQNFLDELRHASSDAQKTAIVDSFIAAVPSFPYIEDTTTVYFIYRGDRRVRVPCVANSWDRDAFTMITAFQSDLQYYQHRFEADARIEYVFTVGLIEKLDPLNPRVAVGTLDRPEVSELIMPGYAPRPEVEYYPDISHGTLHDTTFYSTHLDHNRDIRIYLPHSYDDTSIPSFPVAIFNDGLLYISLAKGDNVLDYLIAHNHIQPVIAVFVPPVDRTPEYGGISVTRDSFAAFISTEIVPYIDSKYRTAQSPASRAVLGVSYGGNISLWIANNYPDVFGNAASFSGSFFPETVGAFQEASTLELKVYLDCGTYEGNLLETSRNFRQILQNKGYDYEYNEWHEGHAWGNWGAHLDNALEFFFPVETLNLSN